MELHKTYHKNKWLKIIVPMVENKRNGKLKRYDNQGRLLEETDYKNDKIHGYQKLYDKEGNLALSIGYYNGFKHGATILYNKGKIKEHLLYVGGKLNNKWLSSL